jgi:hypothetical protein
MAAMAAMLVFTAALIVLAAKPGGDRRSEPGGLQSVPVATNTVAPAETAVEAHPISTPVPLPEFDVLEKRGITSSSPGNEVIAEPVSFITDPEQNLPPPLCVHWKIYSYNADSNSSRLISEFFEACSAEITTSLDLLPDPLVRAENAALRDQLSFLVRQFTWEEYFELSRMYAQSRLSRALEVVADGQASP